LIRQPGVPADDPGHEGGAGGSGAVLKAPWE